MQSMRQTSAAGRWQYVVLIGVILSLLAGFFSRSIEFHDEIINLGKANDATFFDYALRPVFYGINAAAVRIFGDDPAALALAAYFCFAGLACLTFDYVRRDLGPIPALATVSAVSWSGLIYFVGVRGMPHLYPAFFFCLAVYLLGDGVATSWMRRLAITVLLWMTVLAHPTGIALALGFFVLLCVQHVMLAPDRSAKALLKEGASWFCVFAALWVAVELTFLLLSDDHTLYVSYLLEGLGRTSDGSSPKYQEPYLYYFKRIVDVAWPVLAVLSLTTAVAFLQRRFRVRVAWKDRSTVKALALGVAALSSVGIISLEKWKFDRVLVTFLPLVITASCYLLFVVARKLEKGSRAATALAAVLIFGFSLHAFAQQVSGAGRRFEKRYPAHSAAFDVVVRLHADALGYLGNTAHARVASVVVRAADKRFVPLTFAAAAMNDPAVLAKDLIERGQRFVILDVAGPPALVRTFHKLAYSSGFVRLVMIGSREAYEIWDLRPSSLGMPGQLALDHLTRRQRVGALLSAEDQWVEWALAGQELSTASLKATELAAGKLPKAEPVLVLSKAMIDDGIRRTVRSRGYVLVGELAYVHGKSPTVEIWTTSAGTDAR